MSLFERLLEQQLRPAAAPRTQTFSEKREQWLREARAKADRGERLPPPAPPAAPAEHSQAKENRELGEAIAATYRKPLFPAEPVELSGPLVARGSCKAIDAETGRQCRLPAHPKTPNEHRSERGAFRLVAAPGQTHFSRRDALDRAATTRNVPATPGEP